MKRIYSILIVTASLVASTQKTQIAIVSLFDEQYKAVGMWSDLNKRAYAHRHGYAFKVYHKSLDLTRHPAWSKIKAIQRQLPRYKWVYWSDADSLIMNPRIKLEQLIDDRYDIIISQERNAQKNLNTGSILIKNTPWSQQFLQRIYDQEQYKDAFGYWEQAAFAHLVATDPTVLEHIKIVDQRLLNSHWYQPNDTTTLFGADGGEFHPGDFVIHFYGPVTKRPLMEQWYLLSKKMKVN